MALYLVACRHGNEQHKSIGSCDTDIACLEPLATTTTAAASTDFDLETITDSQSGKFNYQGFSWEALSAIAAV